MPSILFIDNNPSLFSAGLELLLAQNNPDNLIELTNLPDLVNGCSLHKDPDIAMVFVDSSPTSVRLKDIRVIQRHFRNAAVVLAGTTHACGDMLDWFRLGVRGYVYLEHETSELYRCIDQVATGGRYIGAHLLDTILLELNISKSNHSSVCATLSRKEMLVAQALSEGLRVTDISEKFGNKCSTISTIKKAVYRKLGITRPVQLYQLMRIYESEKSGDIESLIR
ncbi:hypothetical protein GCM10023091_16770 [Ravibacter arvi]|uniref:HTH luxR-type domain-containing protein n=1 Tax=Ravibacter arvi TaxID=2051041 RepID=A0ABP8LUU9_9BACT